MALLKKYSFIVLQTLKNEWAGFFMLMVFGVSVIWLGGMIAVIGSRRIVKPVQVIVSDAVGKELPSVHVFVKLARAGNAVSITNNKEHREQWSIENVFVEKIMIGATGGDLSRILDLNILIGGKNFYFSGARLLEKWKRFDKSIVRPYIRDEYYNDYMVMEAPNEVRLETSKIPFRKNFFSSLVNWGGDDEVFIRPLSSSLNSIILFILFLVIFRVILLAYGYENITSLGDENDILYRKKQFIVFFLTIISTTATLILAGTLISYFYKPDISQIFRNASFIYLNYQLPAFLPKPVERLQFLLSVFLSPLILTLFYYLFKSKLANIKVTVADFIYTKLSIITACLLFAVIYLGLAMSDFLYIKSSYYSDSLGKYFFNLIIFPALLSIFLFHNSLLKSVQRPAKIFLQSIFYLTMILILTMNILNLASFFSAFHLNPVLYPISQVIAGKILLVNLTSLYGLFPMFLAPLFKVIGFSVLKFSLVMGAILCLSYVFLFKFMRKAINNDLLLYSGFLGVVFYSYLASPVHPDLYFQYWPIRILFPALFLFLIATYFRGKNKYLYYALFVFNAIGVLWNFDSGIIVFLSWIIILTYHEFSEDGNIATKSLKTARHFVSAVVFLVAISLCFYFGTYIFSGGAWPDLSLSLQYQKMFMSGYFMIPMLPPPHAWNLIALVYLFGLLSSVVALVRRKIEYDDKLIFALSILGVGLFSYYEGRSHDLTLFLPSYPAFILVAVFADKLYGSIKASGSALRGNVLVFAFMLFIVISAPFNMIYNVKIYFGYAWSGIMSFRQNGESIYAKNINFIKDLTSRGEGIYILSPSKEGIYYGETGTYSIVDAPSSTDLFFKREADAIVNFLEDNKDRKVFVEQPLNFYDLYDPRIKKTLEKKYAVVSNSESGLSYYKKIINE